MQNKGIFNKLIPIKEIILVKGKINTLIIDIRL